MANELKPIKEAPEGIRNIITRVLDHEKQNVNKKRGIIADIVDIIKEEIR